MVFAINCRQILSNNARRSLERNNLNVTTNFAGFKIQSLQTLLFLRTKNGSDVKDGGRTRTIFQVNNNNNLMQRRRQNRKKKDWHNTKFTHSFCKKDVDICQLVIILHITKIFGCFKQVIIKCKIGKTCYRLSTDVQQCIQNQ